MNIRSSSPLPANDADGAFPETAIAITGMALRVPGADSPEEFWLMSREGRDGIRDLSADDLRRAGLPPDLLDAPGYVPRAATLRHADRFDHAAFGLSAREAAMIDPQHRIFLECVWSAFEAAGRDPRLIRERCGVYASSRISLRLMRSGADLASRNPAGLIQNLIGADKDYLATRVSHLFDLRGPSMTVQTACSSSLVGVHLAVQSLLSGETDIAVAGGVTVNEPQEAGYFWQEGLILSREGICRPFDAEASGTIGGNGCGVVVLRRLSDALADGDPMVAVIRGSAVTNDGAARVGYTAPGMEGQVEAVTEALAAAEVAPESLRYVETHGTGTAIGDPIEIAALASALGPLGPDHLALGSVKANLGHLDAAAGVVSLIKAALAVQHAEIPPMAHFRSPNPQLDLERRGFFVPRQAQPFPPGPVRAGVSSFGFGGTNAHVVLERWPAQPVAVAAGSPTSSPAVLPLSALDPDALDAVRRRTRARLLLDPAGANGFAPALARQQAQGAHRIAALAADGSDLVRALDLDAPAEGQPWWRVSGRADAVTAPVLVFPGQGSQRPGASAELYRLSPDYRRVLHECAEIAAPLWDQGDLADLALHGDAARIAQMLVTQPLIYATQLASVAHWRALGVTPAAVLGQSFGEFAAAVTAGAMSVETGMHMILARSRVIAALPQEGAMASIHGPDAAIRRIAAAHGDALWIAAENGPGLFVLSGRHEALERLAPELDAIGASLRMLRISHALHSPLMDPALPEFERLVEQAGPVASPRLPLYSTLLGRAFQPDERPDARHWARHMRQPVLFQRTALRLAREQAGPFIETGMDASASKLLARCGVAQSRCIPTLDPLLPEGMRAAHAAASAWVLGMDCDLSAFSQPPRQALAPLGRIFARTPIPAPETARSTLGRAPDVHEAARAGRDAAKRGAGIVEDPAFVGGQAGVEALCAAYIDTALAALVAQACAEGPVPLVAALDRAGIAPRFRQFAARLIGQDCDETRPISAPPPVAAETLAKAEALAEPLWVAAPQMRSVVLGLGRALPQILTGARDPLEVLHSAGVMDAALDLYSQTPTARFFNPIIRETFRALQQRFDDSRALNVVEIGAGSGATAQRLLPLLRPDRDGYLFTDIGPQFLNAARPALAEYDGTEFAVLDIGKPPAAQGIREGLADILLAVNVLHAAPDIDAALHHSAALLAPGGFLILDELTHASRMAELTTAILIPPVQDARRGGQPFMDCDGWRAALAEAGLVDVTFLPEPGGALDRAGEHVIIARKPGDLQPHAERRQLTALQGPDLYEWRWHPHCSETEADDSDPLVVLCDDAADAQGLGAQQILSGAELSELPAMLNASTGRPVLLDLRQLAPPAKSSDPVDAACQRLLDLVAALQGCPAPRITLALRRGAVGLHEATDPVQAALLGLARVIDIGHPDLDLRILDIGDMPVADVPDWRPAPPIAALRDGALLTPELARSASPEAEPFRATPADRALIVGGTGGIGQRLALWLIDQGCGPVYVTGRAPEDVPLPAALAVHADRVTRLQFDALDPGSAKALATRLHAEAPELSLIFHCAAATDAALASQTDQRDLFAQVLAPKTIGALALDRLSRDFPIRQFVLFSSSVSMAPSYGLPHYCAANAALDGLAQRRRASGLPGLAISWGAWSDAGVVARHDSAGRLSGGGLRAFASDSALALLALLMAKPDRAHVGAMDMDWPLFLRQFGTAGHPPLYTALAAPMASQGGGERLLRSLDPVELALVHGPDAEAARACVTGYVAAIFAGLTGQSPETIPADRHLAEIGLDSLMFLDAVSHMAQALAVRVSPNAMFRDFTLEGVSGHFLTALRATDAQAAPALDHDAAGRYEPFPLSEVQQAYWIGRASDMDLGGVACHGYSEIDCPDLDPDRLEAAWNRVMARHDMLRAVIRPDGRQQVLPMDETGSYRLIREDLTALAPAQRESRLMELRAEMSHRVTDASRWPLFQIRASRIDARTTRIHFSLDNIIADGRSIGLVLRQWLEAYGNPEASADLPDVTFRDYMQGLAEYRGGGEYATARDWWRARLDDLPPAPALPVEEGRDAGGFARLSFSLSPARWDRLRRLAGELAGATPSGLLLACYAEILSRWSGQARLTVNLPTFNRQPLHPRVAEIVGEFTSMLLMGLEPGRADLRDAPFAARVRHVQSRLFEDQRHDSYSGVEVMRDLARHRGDPAAAQMPVVFTSTFGLAETLDVSYSGGTERVEMLGREVYTISQTPQVLLDNHVHDRGGALHVHWDYRSGRLPEALVGRMFAAYRDLICRLADDPASWDDSDPVETGDILAEWERFNATANPALLPGHAQTLGAGFLASLARRPSATALISGCERLDYAALGRRVGQWLSRLNRLGAGPGERVVVSLPRGLDQIAAVLAVSLSGAAYVPVSPEQPPARRRSILDQIAPRVIIAADPVKTAGAGLLTPESLANEAPAPLRDRASADGLAYVLFTSGSTGTPKGVAIRHAAALATLNDVSARYALHQGDVVLGVSDLGFDLSVFDIFASFAAGAALLLPRNSAHADPAHWLELCAAEGVTVWNSAPAVLEIALTGIDDADPAEALAKLRLVMLSGDWIAPNLPGRITALAPQAQIHSLGGATEAGIWSVSHPLAAGIPQGWVSVPYGRPLANQSLWVLDDAMRPCPPLVPGALWIGGSALADGYWNSPDLTGAAFVTHPRSGERLYRTGDIARLHPEGVLEFLGRSDHQVKINGRRIETGEIEVALTALPGVARAVVAPISPQGGGQGAERRAVALCAWVLPQPGQTTTTSALRKGLRSTLPATMIPEHIVLIDTLPVTANGKLDRKALPWPQEPLLPASANGNAGTLDQLAALLGLTPDKAPLSLFEAGVNSLQMAQAVAALRAQGHAVALADFYVAPSLGALAAQLAAQAGDDLPPQRALAPGLERRACPNRPTLYLHAGADGGAWLLGEVAAALSRDWGLRIAALPEGLSPAEAAASADLSSLPSRLILGGHSLGALHGWALAARLEAEGHPAEAMVVIDAMPYDQDAICAAGGEAGLFARLLSIAPTPAESADALWQALPPDHAARATSLAAFACRFADFSAAIRACAGWVPPRLERTPVLVLAARDADPAAVHGAWRGRAAQIRTAILPGDHAGCLAGDGAAELVRQLARTARHSIDTAHDA